MVESLACLELHLGIRPLPTVLDPDVLAREREYVPPLVDESREHRGSMHARREVGHPAPRGHQHAEEGTDGDRLGGTEHQPTGSVHRTEKDRTSHRMKNPT